MVYFRKNFNQLSKRQQCTRIKKLKAFARLRNKHSLKYIDSHLPIRTVQNKELLTNVLINTLTSNECDDINIDVSEVNVATSHTINRSLNNTFTPRSRGTKKQKIHSELYKEFQNVLRQCCIDYNITHIQTNALLRVLRSHSCFKNLPKDSRKLLRTSTEKIKFSKIGTGIYWHIGLGESLQKHLALYDTIPCILELELSTDGMSLTRSNPYEYWPLQLRVLNIPMFPPVIIGIYKGVKKPADAHLFLKELLAEVRELNNFGGVVFKNERVPFEFKRFIGDAPARSLLLNHYGHNSIDACSKCNVVGTRFNNRTVFIGTQFEQRTNEAYANTLYNDHQKGSSPLKELNIPLVSMVPFEIMHLVYIGVVRKCFKAWINGEFGFEAKLSTILINEMDDRYIRLQEFCPQEFARRPRTLTKFGDFKATEMRQFVLYAAPYVLNGILPTNVFVHFMLLVSAMRLLTSPNETKENINFAGSLLKTFVEFSPKIYTPAFNSYNVHGLLHLATDRINCGPLESCSAFVYENNMPLFKKNIRNHPKPLQQFANRLKEKNGIQHKPVQSETGTKLSKMHISGPIPHDCSDNCSQYKNCKFKSVVFSLDQRNSFCQLTNGSICKIVNFIVIEETIIAIVRRFRKVEDVFTVPVKSSSVGIYKCSNMSDIEVVLISEIMTKCYGMPSCNEWSRNTLNSTVIQNEYILATMLHMQK